MPDDPRDIVELSYDTIADRYADAIRAGREPETYFRTFLARVLERTPREGPSWIWDAAAPRCTGATSMKLLREAGFQLLEADEIEDEGERPFG